MENSLIFSQSMFGNVYEEVFFFFLNLHFLFAMKSNKSNFFQNNLSYMYTVSGIRVELFPYFPLHMYKCFIRFKFCVPIYALHIYKAINWNDIVLGRFYKILMRSNSREKYHLNFFLIPLVKFSV